MQRLPATSILSDDDVFIKNEAIQLKRVAGSTNVTGVYAAIW